MVKDIIRKSMWGLDRFDLKDFVFVHRPNQFMGDLDVSYVP